MANYDFALFTGHGQAVGGQFDPGAVNGSDTEYALNCAIVAEAKKILDRTGKNILYGVNNYANDLLAGHSIECKSALSVHCNGNIAGATGVEIIVPNKETYLVCDFSLVDSIARLGIPNRGVKSADYNVDPLRYYTRTNGVAVNKTDYLREIRKGWEKGIALSILECGFMGTDLQFLKSKAADIGKEIANYACVCMGINTPTQETDWKSLYEQALLRANIAEGKLLRIKELL